MRVTLHSVLGAWAIVAVTVYVVGAMYVARRAVEANRTGEPLTGGRYAVYVFTAAVGWPLVVLYVAATNAAGIAGGDGDDG